MHDLLPLDVAAYRKSGLKARAVYGAVQFADWFVTLSEFTAERLMAHYPRTRGKVTVVPLPPAPVFRPGSLDLAAGSEAVVALVDMATPDPRKRAGWLAPLARLLENRGLRLVVAGRGTDSPSTRALIAPARALGRISDQELLHLLHSSLCFVYLSAYEGQGLPPLEAMAGGCPVIAVRNTAVADVVGRGGVLVDEATGSWDDAMNGLGASRVLNEVAEACGRFAADPAARALSRQSGIEQAGNFTQERFRRGIADAYESARLRHLAKAWPLEADGEGQDGERDGVSAPSR